ncbi:MAG: hypothetical protein U0353_28265, partial [Sandaracinus sp.]
MPDVPSAGLTPAQVFPVVHSESVKQRVQTCTLPRGVVVQVCVAGLQLFAPQSVASVATVQGMHVPPTQRGVPARWLHSVSIVQLAQARLAVSQRLALTLVQLVVV